MLKKIKWCTRFNVELFSQKEESIPTKYFFFSCPRNPKFASGYIVVSFFVYIYFVASYMKSIFFPYVMLELNTETSKFLLNLIF